jgi:hypothetical protein
MSVSDFRRLATLLALSLLPAALVAQGVDGRAPTEDVRLRWPAPTAEARGFRLGTGVVVTRIAPTALPASPFARCLATQPAAECAQLTATVRPQRLSGSPTLRRGIVAAVGRRVQQPNAARADTIRPGVVRIGLGFPF